MHLWSEACVRMILLQATNKVILIHLGGKILLLAERAVGRFLKAEACFFYVSR